MDKWDELTHRVQQALLAEEPDAAISAAFSLVAEFGRTLETISGDMDRIATTLEKAFEPAIQHAEPPAHDL